MDFSKYDQSLQELSRQHHEYLKLGDKKVITVLDEMRLRALAMNDPVLIGYVYHSIAFAEHFIMGRYFRFLKNLSLSSSYLLSCQDQSEMMHIYYLVAIDAMNKGLNDIAVLYFQEARNIAEESGQQTSAAILDESIGHILLQIGQYKEAQKYIRKSLVGIKKDKSHPHYYSNLSSDYMNDVIASLELKDMKRARKSFDQTKAFLEKHPKEFKSGTLLNFQLLRLRLALSDGNEQEAQESYEALLALMQDNSMLHLYMDEIKKLSLVLIRNNHHAWLEEILRIIDENGIAPDAADGLKLLISIKIDYYKALGRTRELREAYDRQETIQERIHTQQKSTRQYVNGLIQLTTSLRKEREQQLARQEQLISMAETDSLTGLSNRYGANLKLDKAFDAAYQNRTSLGIVFLDVDGLKRINDSKGHLEGDKYLMSLANALQNQAVQEGFFASRVGGDEFVLIFEGKSDKEIEAAMHSIKKRTKVPFSSGLYNGVPYGKQKNWDFVEFADMELYKEKQRKRKA